MKSQKQVLQTPRWNTSATRLIASVILVWTFAVSFLWSNSKQFWVDELLEYFSDSKPSFAAVLSGQRYSPFSLEPPLFHLLEHASLLIFPAHPEFACRIVSMISLLVTELCVFGIVRRLGRGRAAALLAMSLPLLFVTGYYATEARVYSLFAALFAVALLSWQHAVNSEGRSRRLGLVALFASLTLAVLSHYYGIFLPLTLLAGELVRTRQRHRLDPGVLAALLLPFAFFALNYPFMTPLPEIQGHYYTGETHWRVLPVSYLWLLIGFFTSNPHLIGARMLLISLVVCAALTAVLLWRVLRARWQPVQQCMVVALVASACLPILNFLVGRLATHAYVDRYSLPAVPAISVLLVLLLPDRVASRTLTMLLAAVLSLASYLTIRAIGHQHESTAQLAAALADLNDINRTLTRTPDQHVYMQDVARFLVSWFYAPPDLRRRLVCVQSADRELRWLGRTPASIFARNIGRTTGLPVVRFETLVGDRRPHLFVIYHDPHEEWIEQEIANTSVRAKPEGKGLGGDLRLLTF